MVQVMLRLTVEDDRRDEVLRTVRSTLGRTRAASGCVSCAMYADSDQANELLYLEEWTSHEQLVRHLRNGCWMSLLAVMEAAAKPPELRFIWSDKTRGLDYLQEVRSGHGAAVHEVAGAGNRNKVSEFDRTTK